MIKPEYITFEQARALETKGFDVNCTMAYAEERLIDSKTGGDKFTGVYRLVTKSRFHKRYYSAPEQHIVVEWLRINHGIWVYVDTHEYGKWCFNYKKIKPHKDYPNINVNGEFGLKDYNSPQSAYSAAFDYVLNNLI
jgi:hypothetical protein